MAFLTTCTTVLMTDMPRLHKGDRIALAATARAVSPEEIQPAIDLFRSWGLETVVPDGLFERCGQLAGSDKHRITLMQQLVEDPSIKAIVCCRGGYGTVRIIDHIDFSALTQYPKWIVGYSDATVLHSHLHATLALPTLHATMPINILAGKDSTPATESLRRALFGLPVEVAWNATEPTPNIHLEGVEIVGGNLSIIYSLLGSRSQIDTRGKVLLIEDLDEYLYHIDRMMQALRRSGMLNGVAALLVGGLNDMHDNATPFGMTAKDIIRNVARELAIPLIFDAPIGHIGAFNEAIPLGIPLNISANENHLCHIYSPPPCC